VRQINLLPPEVFQRRRDRRIISAIVLGFVVILGLLLVVFLVQTGRLSGARGDLAAQERQNKRLQRQVSDLARAAEIQQELESKTQLLGQLTTSEVRWSVVLADVATYIPADVWLTNFTGSVQVGGGTTTGSTGQPVADTFGTVQFSGCTLEPLDGRHLEVAKWLVRIGIPKELVSPYLSLSSKGSDTCPVSFSSTSSLSADALRRNQRGGERTP
jgi:hypothetical protein